MVLLDTSVWIRYLYGRQPYLEQVGRLLTVQKVAAHDLVFGELLVGDTGGRKALLDDYRLMSTLRTLPHDEVVQFVRCHQLQGRGAGWIGIHLLASAIVSGTPLWTADPRLEEMAMEFGVAYKAA